jgi:ComF family protein
MITKAKAVLSIAADMLYPPAIYCISCENLIDSSRPYAICDRCGREIDWRLGELPSNHEFAKGFYCVLYTDPVKRIVRGMKYRDKPYIAQYIAEAMADRAAGEPEIEDADLIVPVPMYAGKKRRRGYNQTELIAAHLSKLISGPCDPNIIFKTIATETLSAKNRDERLIALSDTFAVSSPTDHNSAIPTQYIKGKKILLLDDVFTTGSTADACSRTLLLAGAASVNLFVFVKS